MKLGIFAIVLGILSLAEWVNFQFSSQVLISKTVATTSGYDLVWSRDWLAPMPFAVVGLTLVILGIFRIKWTRTKAVKV